MGHFRFRRSFGSKFLKLNVSKTGFSITGGVPGAHVNADLSGRRKRPFVNTYGIPGTGLSYRTKSYGPKKSNSGGEESTDGFFVLIWVVGLVLLLFLFMR